MKTHWTGTWHDAPIIAKVDIKMDMTATVRSEERFTVMMKLSSALQRYLLMDVLMDILLQGLRTVHICKKVPHCLFAITMIMSLKMTDQSGLHITPIRVPCFMLYAFMLNQ
jgi:hypothetical protein